MRSEIRSQLHNRLTAVSLFTSSGIGDLALRAAGAEVVIANELLKDRADLFSVNFPSVKMIVGDIRDCYKKIIEEFEKVAPRRELDVLYATPPCQGMSKNGRGKLLSEVRNGVRDRNDKRNELALYVAKIANKLNPKLIFFENVPEMKDTLIEIENGKIVNLVEHLKEKLPKFTMFQKIVEFANYGVPQRRQRLITVFVRNDVFKSLNSDKIEMFPKESHASNPNLFQKRWISVNDAISDLPKLDASSKELSKSKLDFHYVPLLDEKKYWWVSSTPIGGSAFDNQCVNKDCLFDGNETHGSIKNSIGINQSKKSTPIYCEKCGKLLPRPAVFEKGKFRIMKGFTSAYKRMKGDMPASALTTNFSYVMSDQKIHPTQNRALSLLEAMRIHTITDYDWIWNNSNGQKVKDKLIRDSIGESIPPRGLETIFVHIFDKILSFKYSNIKKSA